MTYVKCEDCGSVGRQHYAHCGLADVPRVEIEDDGFITNTPEWVQRLEKEAREDRVIAAAVQATADKHDIKIDIADEAKRIVTGARRGAYGTPENNFERIARFWQAYLENTGRGDAKITAADISPMMRLMKEARLCETPDHRDSFVDLVGYTLTGAEVNKVKTANSA